MHCFKCGATGFDHARVAPLPGGARRAAKRITKRPLEPVTLDSLPDSTVARILHNYGLTWLDNRMAVTYDVVADRLCFPLSAVDKYPGNPASFTQGVGWVGKSLKDQPKWYLSDSVATPPADRAYMYLARGAVVPVDTLVLTEDPISALKISESDRKTIAIAMLGLSMPASLLELLGNMRSDLVMVVWPDGDKPGIERGTQIYQQLKFIRPNTQFKVVMGKDPKDLMQPEIGEYLARIRTETD